MEKEEVSGSNQIRPLEGGGGVSIPPMRPKISSTRGRAITGHCPKELVYIFCALSKNTLENTAKSVKRLEAEVVNDLLNNFLKLIVIRLNIGI